jgi:hypothetical protein
MTDLLQNLNVLTYDFTRRLVDELRRAAVGDLLELDAPLERVPAPVSTPARARSRAPKQRSRTGRKIALGRLVTRALALLHEGPQTSGALRKAMGGPSRTDFQAAMTMAVKSGKLTRTGNRSETTYALAESVSAA